jgi:hypothetical protein
MPGPTLRWEKGSNVYASRERRGSHQLLVNFSADPGFHLSLCCHVGVVRCYPFTESVRLQLVSPGDRVYVTVKERYD